MNSASIFTAAGLPLSPTAVNIPDAFKGKLPLGYSFPYFSKEAIVNIVNQVDQFADYNFVNANFYKVREKVFSGYAMGLTTFDWGNIIYGVRVEHVKNSAEAFAQTGRLRVDSDFTAAYPSMHFNWNISAEHKLRLSLNTGAARPDYPVLRPNFTFNDSNLTI